MKIDHKKEIETNVQEAMNRYPQEAEVGIETKWQISGGKDHRCMGDFFPGASKINFKPDSKARPNFFSGLFTIFFCKTYQNCCFGHFLSFGDRIPGRHPTPFLIHYSFLFHPDIDGTCLQPLWPNSFHSFPWLPSNPDRRNAFKTFSSQRVLDPWYPPWMFERQSPFPRWSTCYDNPLTLPSGIRWGCSHLLGVESIFRKMRLVIIVQAELTLSAGLGPRAQSGLAVLS